MNDDAAKRWAACLGLTVLGVPWTVRAESPATAEYLRCEYRVDPLGIDVLQPRLFWEMHDTRRGARQTAYQVLVASSPEKLARDEGDLWDSGKVASDQSTQITYAGRVLTARTHCHWKVRIWDREEQPSAWSTPALWTMGLLRKDDFQTQWIGYEPSGDAKPPAVTLGDCPWVWFPEGEPRQSAPVGRRYFRGKASIPENKHVRTAYFLILIDDGGELMVNGRYISPVNGAANARYIDVADFLEPGENCFAVFAENGGGAAGLAGKLVVTFADNETATFHIDGQWKASATDFKGPDFKIWLQTDNAWKEWLKPEYDDSKWPAVKVLGPVVEKPGIAFFPPRGCPLLRKEFRVEQPVRRATLYASALGVYRMHLNGRPVGNDYFTPDWSDYHIRVYYNTYDVTGLVKEGPNALGGIVGPGWYAGPITTISQGAVYGPHPRLLAQLEIEFDDGSRQVIATDESWKATAGPYVQGEFYDGEVYDSTREIPGWDSPGLDDSQWRPVHTGENNPNILCAFPGVTVQETGVLKPVNITEPKPGRYVFDLGQNFSGVVRLKVKGPRGTHVELRHAERLNADGTIYTCNLANARCRDIYTLRGKGEEVYQPRFTYRSFQYVELRGFPGKPDLDSVTGVALNSAIPLTGEFECSNPMLNRLFANIVWTQRANYVSVPTDCPQRHERLGWLGDAEDFIRAGTYNADVAAFFTKWMVDVDDDQLPDGAFPNVAPRYWDNTPGAAAWGDAGVICPWTIYQVYGDRRQLEQHYPAMTRWIEYCRTHSDKLLRPNEGWGDWLAIKADTPLDVMATAFFAESTRLIAEAAKVLERADDAAKYAALREDIKTAFNRAYVADDGRIKGNTQTCYVLALAFDLLPPEKRQMAVNHLMEDIKARDGRLSCGIVGTSRVMPALSRCGQTPLAYELVQSEKFPSWGFCIKNGATSIWERWDGWTPEKGFQNPSMNSFAHYALGAVGQWLFQTMAGIDTHEPGFQRILIGPEPGPGVDWVRAGYRSPHGRIASAWKKENGKLVCEITIPANTTATVVLPAKAGGGQPLETVTTESNQPISNAPGVKVLGSEGPGLKIAIEAGQYRFETPWPQ